MVSYCSRCVFTVCVCSRLTTVCGWLKAEQKFCVWVTILSHTSRPFHSILWINYSTLKTKWIWPCRSQLTRDLPLGKGHPWLNFSHHCGCVLLCCPELKTAESKLDQFAPDCHCTLAQDMVTEHLEKVSSHFDLFWPLMMCRQNWEWH